MEQHKSELTLIEQGHIAHITIALLSFCAAEFFHRNIIDMFSLPTFSWTNLCLLWVPAAILPCLCHYLCGAWSSLYREHWSYAVADSVNASKRTRIALALGSSVGEELLFRCVLQPWSGILGTVFLVFLLTPGPTGKITPMTGLCCAQTLLYGQMVVITGSLWPSLFAHSVVNLWFLFTTPQQDTSFA